MKKLKEGVLFGLFSLLFAFIWLPSMKVQAAQPVTGGNSMDTALEINVNQDYEAVVPLEYHEDAEYEYTGVVWYKFKVPQYVRYFGLAEVCDSEIDTLLSLYSEYGYQYDMYGIYYQKGDTNTSNLNGEYGTKYYLVPERDQYCYIRAYSTSPGNRIFRIIAESHPQFSDKAKLEFNKEYTSTYYLHGVANDDANRYSASCYCFTAPYTGKYRIYCNSKNGEASCGIWYYTGQQIADIEFGSNKEESETVSLKAGIEYNIKFASGDVDYTKPTIATFYVSNQSVDSIEIEESEIRLDKATQYQLNPIVLPEKAVDNTVTYSTSNKKVALVSKDGCITAVGAGKAIITIDSNDGSGVQTQCEVTVPATKVNRLDLNTTKLVLSKKMKKTIKIIATTYPQKADNHTVTFKSSNSKIVAVNKTTGVLTLKKAGTVKITCITNDGSKIKKTCKVTIKKSYFK